MNDKTLQRSRQRFAEFASQFEVHSKAVEALVAKINELISPAPSETIHKQNEALAQAMARIDPAIPRDLEKTAQTLRNLADKLKPSAEMHCG
jgi:hypothetical protein